MNGIVIVNKPEGFTSHDVVAKLRGIYKTRRIGHSGTLDPMATGVLPIFIGRATRACEFATGHDKIYRAEMRLGITTDTQDITGNILTECPVNVSFDEFSAAVKTQIGEISQIPPMYSAIKVGGKKLYELARSGKDVEREARGGAGKGFAHGIHGVRFAVAIGRHVHFPDDFAMAQDDQAVQLNGFADLFPFIQKTQNPRGGNAGLLRAVPGFKLKSLHLLSFPFRLFPVNSIRSVLHQAAVFRHRSDSGFW